MKRQVGVLCVVLAVVGALLYYATSGTPAAGESGMAMGPSEDTVTLWRMCEASGEW